MTTSSDFAQQLRRLTGRPGDALDLVAEQLDAQGVLLVGGVHLDGVAPDPELAPHEVGIVALVLHVDEPAQDGALVLIVPHGQGQHVLAYSSGEPRP